MAATLLGSGRTIRETNSFEAPENGDFADPTAGAVGGSESIAAPVVNSTFGGVADPQNGFIRPEAEQASALNLFNDQLMSGISTVMDMAHKDPTTNPVELDKRLRDTLEGQIETALGTVRDNHVVPTSFIEGLKRQGTAAAQSVAGATGQIIAGRRRRQQVAEFDALTNGLIKIVSQKPEKLPIAMARLDNGVTVARGTVLSPEDADRKHEEGTRALTVTAFKRIAETKPATVIEAASKGELSALAEEDADAILNTAKQTNAREAAQVKAQKEVEATTKRVTSLAAGKSAKPLDPNNPKDVKGFSAVYDRIESALAAEQANPATRQEAARKVARLVNKAQIMPAKLAAQIDAGLAGQDTPKLINAALAYSEIAARSPKLPNCAAGDRSCLRAALVTAAVKAGLPDEEAKAGAEAAITEPGSQTAKARTGTYRADSTTIETGNAAFLESRIALASKEGNGQAALSAEQRAQFNAQVERFYALTGNLEAARINAYASTLRGVTPEGGAVGGSEGKFQTIGAGGGDGKTLDPNAPLTETGSEAAVRGEVESKNPSGAGSEAAVRVEIGGKEKAPVKAGSVDLKKIKIVDPETGKPIELRRNAVGEIVFKDGLGGERRLSATLLRRIAESPHGDARKKRVIITALIFQKLIHAGQGRPNIVRQRRRALTLQLRSLIEAEFGEDIRSNKEARELFASARRSMTELTAEPIGLIRDQLPDVFRKQVRDQTAGLREIADVVTDLIPVVGTVKALRELVKLHGEFEKAVEAGDEEKADKLVTAMILTSGGLIPIPGARTLSKGAKLGVNQIRKVKKLKEKLLKWQKRRKGKIEGGGASKPRRLDQRDDLAVNKMLTTPRHRVDLNGVPIPKLSSLSNKDARIWYDNQLRLARHKYDVSKSNLPLEEQARRASSERVIIRTQARELMENRTGAFWLRLRRRSKPFDYYFTKYKGKGMSDEDAYKLIIKKSFKPNQEVNKRFIR